MPAALACRFRRKGPLSFVRIVACTRATARREIFAHTASYWRTRVAVLFAFGRTKFVARQLSVVLKFTLWGCWRTSPRGKQGRAYRRGAATAVDWIQNSSKYDRCNTQWSLPSCLVDRIPSAAFCASNIYRDPSFVCCMGPAVHRNGPAAPSLAQHMSPFTVIFLWDSQPGFDNRGKR